MRRNSAKTNKFASVAAVSAFLALGVVLTISNIGGSRLEALREIYPISLGCFIRKPVTIDYLVKRIISELD